MPYVYSTMSQDVRYTRYIKAGDGVSNVEVGNTLIRGKANVADRNLQTIIGGVTEVSDHELTELENDFLFKVHRENGHLRVEQKPVHIEKAIENLIAKDASAPKTPADYNNALGDDDPKLATIDLKKAKSGK